MSVLRLRSHTFIFAIIDFVPSVFNWDDLIFFQLRRFNFFLQCHEKIDILTFYSALISYVLQLSKDTVSSCHRFPGPFFGHPRARFFRSLSVSETCIKIKNAESLSSCDTFTDCDASVQVTPTNGPGPCMKKNFVSTVWK